VSDQRFPTDIALRSSGGPAWLTNVVMLDSGYEKRNQVWARDRAKWDVGNIKSFDELRTILAFFHAHRGRYESFRFKDWLDYQATLETFGTGDGATTTFQLIKTYGTGNPYAKLIEKPVEGTLAITVNGVQVYAPASWSCAYTTGIVTFTSAPTTGHVLKWSGEFDKKARFDTDEISTTYEDLRLGTLHIPIVELKPG
jgi:uncharacterized protein (TIGR02217 family)